VRAHNDKSSHSVASVYLQLQEKVFYCTSLPTCRHPTCGHRTCLAACTAEFLFACMAEVRSACAASIFRVYRRDRVFVHSWGRLRVYSWVTDLSEWFAMIYKTSFETFKLIISHFESLFYYSKSWWCRLRFPKWQAYLQLNHQIRSDDWLKIIYHHLKKTLTSSNQTLQLTISYKWRFIIYSWQKHFFLVVDVFHCNVWWPYNVQLDSRCIHVYPNFLLVTQPFPTHSSTQPIQVSPKFCWWSMRSTKYEIRKPWNIPSWGVEIPKKYA